MKVCQIATVGENIEWVLKGLTLSKVDKLILISTSDSQFVEKITEIKNRLLDPMFEKNPVDIEEKIIESKNPLEFIKILKETILENYKAGYQIDINATAGLRAWQLLGYFTAIQLNNLVKKFFIINKQKGEALILPPEILSKTEQLVLDIINNEAKSIEEIKRTYENLKDKKVSVGLISKYLAKLKEKDLIHEFKRERFKYFELTHLGKIYNNNLKYYSLNN